jgi:carboxypeptidase T
MAFRSTLHLAVLALALSQLLPVRVQAQSNQAQSNTILPASEQAPLQMPNWHRVRVQADAAALSALGIAADHGLHKPGSWFEGDLSDQELQTLDQQGLAYTLLQRDVSGFYARRAAAEPVSAERWPGPGSSCLRDPSDFAPPAAFVPGSMAGYLTLDEVYERLDSMAARYPHLVSPRQPFGSQLTHQGRSQFLVKLSDNPLADEPDEPKVLYTALMHAREPAGMMSVIFFMEWLLENYGSDPRATYVLERCQLYFVPVINPDGYEFNRSTNPTGGGMWRKNMRNNGSSTGVDLNRNWPYEWGFDNSGSSPTPSSDVYRGPGPGSEPEIINLMELAHTHAFRTAFNYHSFGNLLLYPFGYDLLVTPDHTLYRQASKRLVRENFYNFGIAFQTVGYVANGVSDDWFYGEQSTRDKTYAWTPEVGLLGFWPPATRILPMAQENALANLILALLATRYGEVEDLETALSSPEGTLHYRLRGVGLVPADATLRAVALSDNLSIASDEQRYEALEAGEQVEGGLDYRLSPDIRPGDEVAYAWVLNWGDAEWRHEVRLRYLPEPLALQPDPSWQPYRESSSQRGGSWIWGDSPGGNYPDQAEFSGSLGRLDLRADTEAWLSLDLRWQLESGFDYALLEASADSGRSWSPLCGRHTRQSDLLPFAHYTGESDWVREWIDLSDYAGGVADLRLRVLSDESISGMGMDLRKPELLRVSQSATAVIAAAEGQLRLWPNPSQGAFVLAYSQGLEADAEAELWDASGRLLQRWVLPAGDAGSPIALEATGAAPGFYTVLIRQEGRILARERLALVDAP